MRDTSFPTIVMHNWHEYGYWKLDGQLVANPGGLDAGEEKFIYPGHRPTFVVLPYLLKELPGAAGGDGLFYDLAVLAITYAAILCLLGMNLRGLLVACVMCLTPGFFNNIAVVDTIDVPALFGIAAMSFAGGCLARSETKISMRLAAIAMMCLYMLLNWSTLFSLMVVAIYILCRRRDWIKSACLFTLPLSVGVFVLAMSLHNRHAAGTSDTSFWNQYLWGPLGYDGHGMNFWKAIVRIMAVNFVAWLPLAIAGLAILLVNGLGENWRRAPWPLLTSFAAVFLMRNYNAHHPWGVVSIIGLGLLFSIELLTSEEAMAVRGLKQTAMVGGVAVFTLIFLAAFLALNEFNGRNWNAMMSLVSENTPRHALIVVSDDLLPNGGKFFGAFDRKQVSIDKWSQPAVKLESSGKEIFLLTHSDQLPPNTKFVARSQSHATWADRVMVPLFEFYRTKISRRAPGNRTEYYEEYRLYRLMP